MTHASAPAGRELPRLLDLYSGAGGAARGYQMAGFHVTGVDNRFQPRYAGDAFIQADALEYVAAHGHEYDAIHASPPCQYYSRLRHLPWLRDKVYWRSIPPTREALQAAGKPYVIENVEDASWDMLTPSILCGFALGLPLYRHRCFETSPFAVFQPGHAPHRVVIAAGNASLGKRHHGLNVWNGNAGLMSGVARHRVNMGIDWMTGVELAQAIPPPPTPLSSARSCSAPYGNARDRRAADMSDQDARIAELEAEVARLREGLQEWAELVCELCAVGVELHNGWHNIRRPLGPSVLHCTVPAHVRSLLAERSAE